MHLTWIFLNTWWYWLVLFMWSSFSLGFFDSVLSCFSCYFIFSSINPFFLHVEFEYWFFPNVSPCHSSFDCAHTLSGFNHFTVLDNTHTHTRLLHLYLQFKSLFWKHPYIWSPTWLSHKQPKLNSWDIILLISKLFDIQLKLTMRSERTENI